MSSNLLVILSLAVSIFACQNTGTDTNSEDANTDSKSEQISERVFFVEPNDGDTVSSPVQIQMGVEGMQVEPAGMSREGFGHHHILLNMDGWTVNEIIPMSDSTFHYGKGQTNATLELNPGEYKITLQFADGVHASYGKEMSTSIKITVQ